MDDFKLKLRLEQISKMTGITELKRVMSNSYPVADHNYAKNDYTSYSITNISKVNAAMTHYTLHKAALARYKELDFDITKLPIYATRPIKVNLLVTLETAQELIEYHNSKD